MSKDDGIYLGHMLDLADKALTKLRGKSRADFDHDENLQMALTLILQNLGEAARHVSSAGKNALAHLPWKQIVGMRNRIVHDYLHVDYDIVWDVVTVDLPGLADDLRKSLPAASP